MRRATAGFILYIAAPAAAQLKVGFSNVVRYGGGYETSVVGEFRKQYFEDFTDVSVLVNNVRLGTRLEISDPPERVARFRGIRRLFAEYVKDEGLSLRAGTLYDLFGRGLSLNLFENRALGFDTMLEGIRAEYSSASLTAKAVGGNVKYVDIQALSVGVDLSETYKLWGAMAEIHVDEGVSLGVSYLNATSQLPDIQSNRNSEVRSQIPEVFAKIRYENLELYAAHVERFSQIQAVDSGSGGSTYASVSYVGDGFGITAEYKDYRLDLVDPIQRVNARRLTRVLAFQNPPTLIREHSFALLTRYPHIVDFGDEVGLQINISSAILENLSVELNTSIASRHFAYSFDRSTFTVSKMNETANVFPSLDKTFSPYWEVYGEGEWSADDGAMLFKLGVAKRDEFFYEIIDPAYSEDRSLTGLVGRAQYVFDETWGVKLTGERVWVSSQRGPLLNRWFDWAAEFEISMAPTLSFGIRYDETSWNETPGPQRNWVSTNATARLGPSNTLELSYGSERGGLVCANGICRAVNPFNGFRMSLTTRY